jgi:hypothetical protein
LTGFLVLLLYVWLGEFWVAAYNVLDYPSEAPKMRRLLHFQSHLAGPRCGPDWCRMVLQEASRPAEDQASFPGYLTFLVVGALLPAVSLFPAVRSSECTD